MYNVATYLATMRRILEGTFGPDSSEAYPDAELLVHLNEAQRSLADAFPWLIGRTQESISLTAGTSVYDLPASLMGLRVQSVCLVDGNSTVELGRIPYEDALSGGMVEDGTAGWPNYWAFTPSGQLMVLPTPNRDLTMRLLIDPMPEPLTKVFYQPAVVRANGTSGSDALSLVATSDGTTAWTGINETESDVYWAGMELGFCTVNTVLGNYNMPLSWTRVLSSDMASGALTINTPLAVSVTSGVFIAGQVSVLERRNTGRLGMLPAQLACIELLQLSDPQSAANLQSLVQGKVAALRPDMQPCASASGIPLSPRMRRGINLR